MKQPGTAPAARKAAASARGQSLVEVAIIAPFVFFLIVLVIDFAGLIGAWMVVANAARAAADYAILSGSSAGLPGEATSTSLQNLINADMAALPGLSSTNPNACVQENNNGTYAIILQVPSGACANYSDPPSDGEDIASGSTTQYINLAVDITYTYTPFMVGSRFLGYFLPNIPTSVHQRSVMRIL
ncbi:MAG TPA: TadE family protein [Bryobacteraceae bacterium]